MPEDRKKRGSVREAEEERRDVSSEVAEEAEKLLRDPDLLCRVVETLHELGLVGETQNALLTFLTMVSSRLDEPVNLRWSGRASTGKSAIVTKVAQLWPPEDLIIRGGLTKKALYYPPEAEKVDETTRQLVLKGKVLVVLEEAESREFLDEAKPLLSHDVPELKYSFVEKRVTKTVILEGWPVYIGVTATPVRGEEHETRTLLAAPDRGRDKYRAVVMDDAERHAFPWAYRKPNLKVWHEALRKVRPLKVWIPWLPAVADMFPTDRAGSMRDWKKLRTLIAAVALLHQYQRPHVIINGEEYVVAAPLDVEVALKVVEGALAETMLGLEKDVRDFFEAIKKEGGGPFTYRELQSLYEKHFGEPIGRTTLRVRYVEPLKELGLLEKDESKKPFKFTVRSKSLTSLADSKKLLEKILSEETRAELEWKILAHTEGVDNNILQRALEEVYSLTLSRCVNLKRLLERSKEEEYGNLGRFFNSVKDVNISTGDGSRVKTWEVCTFCGRELLKKVKEV